jgi:Mlc titration factor MtfA (ptsG expression regulator)
LSWMHPFRTARRNRATSRPFPAPLDQILARNFPLDARLPESDRIELRRRMQIFLAEKRFEGAGGLEMTDEIGVTVAAQACLLLLHRGEDDYPALSTILVYPAAYRVPIREHSADGMVTEGHQVRLGEAWNAETVVLSWDDVRRGAAGDDDGHNVVFHEFAHQLDMEDRDANGAPALAHHSMYAAWARVLGHEYEQLQDAVDRHQRTLMDAYGTQSPAEFFAVATETFFEKPIKLRDEHSELYAQLREFYRQDPAAWWGDPSQAWRSSSQASQRSDQNRGDQAEDEAPTDGDDRHT